MSTSTGTLIGQAEKANAPAAERLFMYIAYLDDSGSTGRKLDDASAPFQIVGGPIIKDSAYMSLEYVLSGVVAQFVPEENWDCFEFHTSHLLHGTGVFSHFGAKAGLEIIEQALRWVKKFNIPIVYGAVDKAELETKIYNDAHPLGVAFAIYLRCLDNWFTKRYVLDIMQKQEPATALLICDDPLPPGRKETEESCRGIIQRVFRRNRKRPRGGSPSSGMAISIFDDIYFGDSKYSIGIQLADICAYFIGKHLAHKDEFNDFYGIIKDQILASEVFPGDDD
ncbi:MAG TPA: DUF3800 domain-containing protein [Terriglobia bacterium]|nr:DUF3800 domain-containing protein [Terriglobia bacterium]